MSKVLRASKVILCSGLIGCCILAAPQPGFAQQTPLPGPADIDRVKPGDNLPSAPPESVSPALPPQAAPLAPPPEGAEQIKFILKDLTVTGVTAYDRKEIATYYQDMVGKEISLAQLWTVAADITKHYRDDGYFLTRAVVPAQEIGDGTATIKVVEGYIGDIVLPAEIKANRAVRAIAATLKKERPANIKTIERQHLLLSDLPGLSAYQGTLAPLTGRDEGAVQLVFQRKEELEKHTSVWLDNMGSRYLGPYQISASWQGNLIPQQKTIVSATSSLPTKELSAVNITQQIPLQQDLRLDITGGYTRAEPGYDLRPQEIESKAINAGFSLNYQVIRQRQENLSFQLGLDGRNSDSTILGTDLTQDRIRALRLSATYDTVDQWRGYNIGTLTLTRGIPAFGASDENDLNISRAGAEPDFTKAELQYKRLQAIGEDWAGILSFSAQKASGSLYSSEEFGFGGPNLGRAYDPSEISGDDGIAAGIEFRYQSLPEWHGIQSAPYAFYDIGKVWNKNLGQEDSLSASSAGLGVRFEHSGGITGSLQLAVPLTKPIDTPLYGGNGENARVSFQLGYSF